MAAPQTVAQLVERFHRNHDAYISGQYNDSNSTTTVQTAVKERLKEQT